MPNKITYTVKTTNSTRAVQYWNPATNQYVDTNPILNIPAGTYSGLKVRFKGDPLIEATYPNSVTVIASNSGDFSSNDFSSNDFNT